MNVGANLQLSGEYGGRYLTSASGTVQGNWYQLEAVGATVLGAITSNIVDLPSGVNLAAGQTLNGVFTSVAVTSGAVIALNRRS
jgi:hypothetical protein